MKLTNQHIQDLYAFTRQHYVEYYDVQTELVDHLANEIETIWQEQPTLTFKVARDLSFKRFGIFGFMDVVEKRQKAMSKKYLKIMWSFVKEWFQLPKISITLGSVFILQQVFMLPFGATIVYALFGVLLIFLIYNFYKLRKESKQRFKLTTKKWMLEELIFKTTIVNSFVFLSSTFNTTNTIKHTNQFGTALFFAIFFVVAFLVAYITLVVIPKQADALLAETYPAYNMI